MKKLENEIRDMIVNKLELDDVDVNSIEFDAPIFESYDEKGEGLGLDSVDALELVVAINDQFKIKISDDDMAIFKSINSIADFIRSKKEEEKIHE